MIYFLTFIASLVSVLQFCKTTIDQRPLIKYMGLTLVANLLNPPKPPKIRQSSIYYAWLRGQAVNLLFYSQKY